MAAREERRVGDAPDLFVGMGEAADALDVPHVWLHAAIREGRLATYAGRREGRLVRLLRLGDLVALDPRLADRPLPRLAHTRPVVSKPPPSEPARPHSASAADPSDGRVASRVKGNVPGSAPGAGVASRSTRRARGDGASQEESLRYLWGELERVRLHVRDSRERQDELVRQLLESGEDARRLFEKLSLDDESRRAAQAELARERADVDLALAELRRARRLTLASVSVVVALAVTAIAYVARGPIEPARAAAESSASVPSGEASGEAPSGDGEHFVEPAAPTLAAADEDRAHPVSLVADPAESPPASPDDEPERGRRPERRLEAPEVPEDEPGVATDVIAEVPTEEDAAAVADATSTIDRALPGRPPAGVRPGDRACALFAVTQPGMPLRGVLGSCWGRWNPELGATVGSSRNGDESYCRQHAFFDRALGASLARARQEADLARDAGLVPPLLRMRVETAASAALAEHVPSWLESGFEAGSVAGHRVSSVEGDANHWLVESWVRYVDFAGNDRRRTFRLEVLLGDGPEPDRERSFAWTDEAPEEKSRRDEESPR